MKKFAYLIPVLILLASCSTQPSEADALRKLNRVVNPSEKSLFRYVDLKIIKKSESGNNNRRFCNIDYAAVREANKDIIARKNVMGTLEYIDTSITDSRLNSAQFFKSVKKGDIIDTLHASMTLVKNDNGWQ